MSTEKKELPVFELNPELQIEQAIVSIIRNTVLVPSLLVDLENWVEENYETFAARQVEYDPKGKEKYAVVHTYDLEQMGIKFDKFDEHHMIVPDSEAWLQEHVDRILVEPGRAFRDPFTNDVQRKEAIVLKYREWTAVIERRSVVYNLMSHAQQPVDGGDVWKAYKTIQKHREVAEKLLDDDWKRGLFNIDVLRWMLSATEDEVSFVADNANLLNAYVYFKGKIYSYGQFKFMNPGGDFNQWKELIIRGNNWLDKEYGTYHQKAIGVARNRRFFLDTKRVYLEPMGV